jgi:tetratricopeptide (TPR) repeat protein
MRRIVFLTLVVMLFVLQGIVVGVPGETEKEVPKAALKLEGKAEKALKDKKYDKALEYYNEAVKIAPEYARLYYGLARIQVEQKKLTEADANLAKAVELAPGDTEIKQLYARNLFGLGKQEVSQRQYQEANGLFLKILNIPGIETLEKTIYWETLSEVALSYERLKDFSTAIEYFLKLLEQPGIEEADKRMVIQALYQVGINYYNLKKAKESNEYLLKLLQYPELETDYPQLLISIYYLVGLNANLVNDYEKSIEYLVKFLELGETSTAHSQLLPVAYFLLGASHMALLQKEANEILQDKEVKGKKTKVADLAKTRPNIETYLTKAIQLRGDLEPAYMHLGNYYYYCDDLDKAIETYQTLLEKFPGSPDLKEYRDFLESIKKEKEDSSKEKK